MERKYTKDPLTGAVIFHDTDAYARRKKIIAAQKAAKAVDRDKEKVINSLRNEISELKEMVNALTQQGPGGE